MKDTNLGFRFMLEKDIQELISVWIGKNFLEIHAR